MERDERQPRLAPEVLELLEQLRTRIRRYVWIEGIGYAIAALLAAFWISLLVDWLFEPPAVVRAALIVGALVAAGWVLWRYGVSRALVPLPDRSMALLIERRFGKFHDSLLTAVELTEPLEREEPFLPEMLDRTCRQAQLEVSDVDLDEIFDAAPLTRAVSAALLLVVTVLIFGMTATDELGVWGRRNLLLSSELWPRQTRLVVDGFEDGVIKVARGSDLEVIAGADTSMEVPRVVQIRFRTDEGVRGWANMTRDGNATPGEDPYQRFSHRFQGVLSPIRFDVVGGDDRVRDLRIEVVESPTISEMELDVQFPSYTRREDRTMPVSGLMQIPRGSQVTVKARASKDLVQVTVEEPTAQGLASHQLHLWERDRRAFEFPLGRLDADKTLLFTLLDEDGIRNRDPIRVSITATRDEPPELAVRLSGIGSAVTPRARIPIAGNATDDYGIARLWFECLIDGSESQQFDLGVDPAGRDELPIDHALEVRDLQLRAGQKLTLSVKAHDTYALGEGPNTGASDRFLLDVVTPEELRAMLEARELNLRRRFEKIMEEVTDTRDALARIDFAAEPPSAADEPEDAEASGDESNAEPRAAELRRLQAERALQNTRKNASETRGVGTGFDEIHDELVNNRVDTEELKSRLKQSIADPLKQIADVRFAELVDTVTRLQDQADDRQAGPPTLAVALQQSDALLVEMQQVLAKMLELETFNEVVAMLRAIVESQESLQEETQQRRRQKVRELLED